MSRASSSSLVSGGRAPLAGILRKPGQQPQRRESAFAPIKESVGPKKRVTIVHSSSPVKKSDTQMNNQSQSSSLLKKQTISKKKELKERDAKAG